MKTLLLFIGLLLVSMAGAGLLIPLIWPLLDGHQAPHEVINKTAKLIAVPLVVLLVIRLRLGGWEGIGFNLPRAAFWRELARGWLLGVLVMVLLCACLLWLGARVPRPIDETYWVDLARSALIGLFGGLLVACVEEIFVRGAMFTAMRRELSLAWVAILSSLYFAALHFIRPLPVEQPDVWWAGLAIVAGAFWQLAEPLLILDSLVALFMASLLLCLLREWRANIAFVIGMHAGWVFVIKIFKSHSWLLTKQAEHWAIGNYDKVTGWLATIWLLVLTIGLLLWRNREALRDRLVAKTG